MKSTEVSISRSSSLTRSIDYSVISAPSLPATPHTPTVALPGGSSRTVTPESVPTSSSSLAYFTPPLLQGSEPNLNNTSSTKSGSKRILPRLLTALTSPTREATIRLKRMAKGKGKTKANDFEPYGDYPLDGEEGELLDDEACFVDDPKTIDLISSLPPEIALHILIFADLPTVLICLRVSRNWCRLASDPLIWRSLFRVAGWEINNELAQQRIMAGRPPTWRTMRTNSIISVAASFRDEVDNALNLVRRRQSPSSPGNLSSPHSPSPLSSGTLHRLSLSSMNTMVSSSPVIGGLNPFPTISPLALDWMTMYKARHEIERRVCGSSSHVSSSDNPDATVGTEPRLMRLTGHRDSVYCLDFDAHKIISGSRDRTIKIWSLRTGKLKNTLRGHEGSVLCLKFDSTGFMVSGSSDRKILVWDLTKREVRKTLTGHQSGVLDLCFDKQWIVSCSKDTVVRVWDRVTLDPYCAFQGHDGPVNAVGLQDGKIVSASGDGGMILWDIATRSKVRSFGGHGIGLACIEFKGDYICSGSKDKNIRVWSVSTGQCLFTLQGHEDLVRALSFNPRTGHLVSGSYDKTVKLWDIRAGKLIREFKNVHHSHVFDVRFDASHIVRILISLTSSTSYDHNIVVLDWSYGLDATLFV
ncbi:WD40 repeat-like protein [Hysterangium stoloniferum]|nr:WD40 repeat-like protein [Hysterangium stoloniferum]